MKIAIVGTGAMGSVYAGLFASAGHEVWAIDRWKDHVDAMRASGLRLEGASGDRTVKVQATTNPKEAGPCDLVVLATKAMHVAPAAVCSMSRCSSVMRSRVITSEGSVAATSQPPPRFVRGVVAVAIVRLPSAPPDGA